MPDRKVYAGTHWWSDNERDLLDLKIAESAGYVDQWLISQGMTTLRGHPRDVTVPFERDDVQWCTARTDKLRGSGKIVCRARLRLQRDVLLKGIELQPDDIFMLSDLDEIVHRQDWPSVLSAADEYGLVWLVMRTYIGKINTPAARVPLAQCCAVTGRWLTRSGISLSALRSTMKLRTKGFKLPTRGQHFSWLYAHDDLAAMEEKLHNYDHVERDNDQSLQDMRKCAGRFTHTGVVEIDGRYPDGIRDNMELWQKYVAEA